MKTCLGPCEIPNPLPDGERPIEDSSWLGTEEHAHGELAETQAHSGQGLSLVLPDEQKTSARSLFQAYAPDHEVVWLVVTIPFTHIGAQKLTSVFEGIYDLQQASNFKGIAVFKMSRHSP